MAESRGRQRQVVLVVDDEAPMRKYVSVNLAARGFEVLVAADGAEALRLLARSRVDLLILDLTLPGLGGLALLREVRDGRNLPVLVVSARDDERDEREALGLGAAGYLRKPFGVEELLARIRAALSLGR